MTSSEANRIIAEYMGDKGYCFGQTGILPLNFHLSLDALVPVWEKMKAVPEFKARSNELKTDRWTCSICYPYMKQTEWIDYTFSIQEAAAIATAKAIQELSK